MQKYLVGFITIAILALPLGTIEAKMIREQKVIKVAEANFFINNDCENVSVGVNVTNNILAVFGSFVDNCQISNNTSFFGTTTVSQAEFSQDDVGSAMLNKTFTLDGHKIDLSLVWQGVGQLGGEDLTIYDKETKTKRRWRVTSRNAKISGQFIIDGLNYISDSSLINAQLEVIKTNFKTKN